MTCRWAVLVPLLLTFLCLLLPCIHSATIGVDFGTEWIKVGLVKPGRPMSILLNDQAERKNFAGLSFTPEGRLFGSKAQYYMQKDAKSTAAYLKPFLSEKSLTELSDRSLMTFVERGLPYSYASSPILSELDDDVGDVANFYSLVSASRINDYSIEELVGSILENIKLVSQHEANATITDAVFTVPQFLSPRARQRLLDAASIANLNVLALVTDGSALAMHYATSRKIDGDQTVAFFDMGARSTSVTIASFSQVSSDEATSTSKSATKGKSSSKSSSSSKAPLKSFLQVTILGEGYDESLGGISFDEGIVQWIIKSIVSKGKAEESNIRSSPRSMNKLYGAAERAKRMLTTNSETTILLEDLTPELEHFGVTLTREIFERDIANVLTDRIAPVFSSALHSAAIRNIEEVSSVVLFGGASRMPLVEKTVVESIDLFCESETQEKKNCPPLTKIFNMDEAAALGASFTAASVSSSFVLPKRVVLSGGWGGVMAGVDVAIHESESQDIEENDGVNEEQYTTDSLFKNYTLFPRKTTPPTRKQLIFRNATSPRSFLLMTSQHEMQDRIEICDVEIIPLPFRLKEKFDEEIEEDSKADLNDDDNKPKNIVDETPPPPPPTTTTTTLCSRLPQMTSRIELDRTGSVVVGNCVWKCEEDVPDVSANVSSSSSDSSSSSNVGKNVTIDSINNGTDVVEEQDLDRKTVEAEATVVVEEEMKIRTITHTKKCTSNVRYLWGLTEGELRTAKKRIAADRAHDERIRIYHEAQNTLETLLFSSEETLYRLREIDAGDVEEGTFEKVVSADQLQEFYETREKIQDWVEEGAMADAALEDIRTKISQLEGFLSDCSIKVTEYSARDNLINSTQEILKTMKTILEEKKESEGNRTTISDREWSLIFERIESTSDWFEQKLMSQEKLSDYDVPVLRSAEVQRKVERLTKKVTLILNRSPKPIPKPKNNTSNSNDTEVNNATTSADTPKKEEETEEVQYDDIIDGDNGDEGHVRKSLDELNKDDGMSTHVEEESKSTGVDEELPVERQDESKE